VQELTRAKELIWYDPKCDYCDEVKGDRRCVGVEGMICFGCAHSRKKCSIKSMFPLSRLFRRPILNEFVD
jgi:hypothetical protein